MGKAEDHGAAILFIWYIVLTIMPCPITSANPAARLSPSSMPSQGLQANSSGLTFLSLPTAKLKYV